MHALSSGMRRVTKFNVIEVIEVNGGGGGGGEGGRVPCLPGYADVCPTTSFAKYHGSLKCDVS